MPLKKILKGSRKFKMGIIILGVILLFGLLYPFFNGADPFAPVGSAFESPSRDHVLGTDNFGRDVLLSLAYGTRTSFVVGMLAGAIATIIGVTLGLFAGYRGGFIDEVLMAFANLFTVIPPFVILILISVSVQSRSIWLTAAVIGVTTWPWTARSVRAQTVSLRNRDHINIAKLTGFSTAKIIMKEVLPYIMSYIFMCYVIQITTGILSESGVSMLGLGPLNTVSLGIMLNWAILFEAPVAGAWWAFVPAAFIVAFMTFSLYLIQLGMDEIFNPKLRS